MIAHFHIHYKTSFGEKLKLTFENASRSEAIFCQTYDGENWTAALEIEDNSTINYNYQLDSPGGIVNEWGKSRSLQIQQGAKQLFIQDTWRSPSNPNNAFFSNAFKEVIFKRQSSAISTPSEIINANRVTFRLFSATLEKHQKFCILGEGEALGNWIKPIILEDSRFPLWQKSIDFPETEVQIRYKYAIYDEIEEKVTTWEKDDDRVCYFNFPENKGSHLIRTDENFRFASLPWRGTGIVIPVFSLRSNQGLGIGEFTDLHLLTDWAKDCNMKLVQVLPVNDTIASRSWTDSYPYAAISVFALHPLYVNLQSIAVLEDKKMQEKLVQSISNQNKTEQIDIEAVTALKFEFFKALYQQEKKRFWSDNEVSKFIAANESWLNAYAAFCYLRDHNIYANFNICIKHKVFSEKVINEVCDKKAAFFDEVGLYYFIQYHAHKQLHTATQYARSKGIVLKGDLPIGIYRYSCDAWVAPQLYNMDEQAGAPPDDFAVSGQNWGFPTYNWEIMAKDNFAWWQNRMHKLSEYFDALRIDHILGFFRIWQIPTQHIDGTMGLFNPRLPYSLHELEIFGLRYMVERFCKPYIRGHFLRELFAEKTEWVINEFLNEVIPNEYNFKDFCNNQVKIKNLFLNNKKYASMENVERGLSQLVTEVLFLEEPGSNNTAFNPRITLFKTRSFEELDEFNQHAITKLYNDYFFRRHDEFWKKQALWKLPALLNATNMLICGEDLGMIPNGVPDVMRDLNIISLEIQRMPKENQTFGDTRQYPYMSVCSPSCHDMSTVRGWWEADYALTQLYYKEVLGQDGIAPRYCTPEIVESIIRKHLDAPSMWAIFPIQDLIGMNETLRRKDAASEQINDPSNPQHYWRYRFHIPLEELNKQKDFTHKVKRLVLNSGR